MPATQTTSQTTASTLRLVLPDYELHHSQPARPDTGTTSLTSPGEQVNPPGWTNDYRRVPSYRPVNRTRDTSGIIVFRTGGEEVFVRTMFFGIRVVTFFHRAWTMTGGRVRSDLFRYKIGPEH